eukprot:COSAG06_NODE_8675_length_2099_cov_3.605551_1_plen_95_part_10
MRMTSPNQSEPHSSNWCAETSFCDASLLLLKTERLPRQARDKYVRYMREADKKSVLQGLPAASASTAQAQKATVKDLWGAHSAASPAVAPVTGAG